MQNSVIDIIYYVGFNGPIINFVIVLLYLIYCQKYILFLVFCGGFLINYIINGILKEIIREPRPIDNPYKLNALNALNAPNALNALNYSFITSNFASIMNNEMYDGSQNYGMPSGHAQLCFYSIAFLFAIIPKRHYWVLIVLIIIGILTLIQRWKFRRHTIKQLFAGSLVGTLMGYGTNSLYKVIMG